MSISKEVTITIIANSGVVFNSRGIGVLRFHGEGRQTKVFFAWNLSRDSLREFGKDERYLISIGREILSHCSSRLLESI